MILTWVTVFIQWISLCKPIKKLYLTFKCSELCQWAFLTLQRGDPKIFSVWHVFQMIFLYGVCSPVCALESWLTTDTLLYREVTTASHFEIFQCLFTGFFKRTKWCWLVNELFSAVSALLAPSLLQISVIVFYHFSHYPCLWTVSNNAVNVTNFASDVNSGPPGTFLRNIPLPATSSSAPVPLPGTVASSIEIQLEPAVSRLTDSTWASVAPHSF